MSETVEKYYYYYPLLLRLLLQLQVELTRRLLLQLLVQPIINDKLVATANHRILLSLRESARIIGTKGVTIQKIRTDNNVKIGISDKEPGCSDRILLCNGPTENVANAIGDIIDVLTNEKFDNQLIDDDISNVSNGPNSVKHVFHYLNFILPPPTVEEIKENPEKNLKNIGNLRLLVTNSQLSGIIGKNGNRIKSLIDNHGVKIVASKDFLPDSDERILEIQGFPGSISNVIVEINSILVNEVDITFVSERLYYPHSKKRTGNGRNYRNSNSNPNLNANANINTKNNNNNNNNTTTTTTTTTTANTTNNNSNESSHAVKDTNRQYSTIVRIPEQYVGAIVGRQGNRIANLRKFTKTKILINKREEDGEETGNADEGDDEEERSFEIISDHLKNVKLAESMLLKNLETEIQRRNESSTNEKEE
ncbi:hypothetical protein TBLA_0G03570 [Henningerozyma blattae CBS 6284]|uniref:K Homology domain-containing protein n=1 Tax=Henningerozyma blattae (strain ATCC 34711 / CBS 6284 / DSM 70876 / NBRC 10599 / NRRL Y-10934 / UCD 77-7) TaxID=1071380 RepID=I2H7E1_HENB6|nr:hypothetical protein TBLA_0G03570 [Tetrapisispora blattae CBS 6284]CCH62293.1 hypothetical protein TBLA_0G03570 [Tetrapisispora blattae CBS 6284]